MEGFEGVVDAGRVNEVDVDFRGELGVVLVVGLVEDGDAFDDAGLFGGGEPAV